MTSLKERAAALAERMVDAQQLARHVQQHAAQRSTHVDEDADDAGAQTRGAHVDVLQRRCTALYTRLSLVRC